MKTEEKRMHKKEKENNERERERERDRLYNLYIRFEQKFLLSPVIADTVMRNLEELAITIL